MRSRQIAVLRAVGAVKSQVIRLVLVEAITLGLLGSVMGLALGLHTAYSDQRITAGLVDVTLDYIVPTGTIALSVGLTVAVCLIAGIAPARRAARNNIIEAMQTV
jgi:putative ABC transport system permease protein